MPKGSVVILFLSLKMVGGQLMKFGEVVDGGGKDIAVKVFITKLPDLNNQTTDSSELGSRLRIPPL